MAGFCNCGSEEPFHQVPHSNRSARPGVEMNKGKQSWLQTAFGQWKKVSDKLSDSVGALCVPVHAIPKEDHEFTPAGHRGSFSPVVLDADADISKRFRGVSISTEGDFYCTDSEVAFTSYSTPAKKITPSRFVQAYALSVSPGSTREQESSYPGSGRTPEDSSDTDNDCHRIYSRSRCDPSICRPSSSELSLPSRMSEVRSPDKLCLPLDASIWQKPDHWDAPPEPEPEQSICLPIVAPFSLSSRIAEEEPVDEEEPIQCDLPLTPGAEEKLAQLEVIKVKLRENARTLALLQLESLQRALAENSRVLAGLQSLARDNDSVGESSSDRPYEAIDEKDEIFIPVSQTATEESDIIE